MFTRVHRSYIINKKGVSSLVVKGVTIDEFKISISTHYFDALEKSCFYK
ncbi:LytTR family transcriptional regulator DNA-binding domain-containing protein [Psychroflexus sp. MES1-P1E]